MARNRSSPISSYRTKPFDGRLPLGGYILDFVCFEVKLIIEVDGGQHSESIRDVERDRYFESQGFRTLRFWNDEVEQDIDGVCATILDVAKGNAG